MDKRYCKKSKIFAKRLKELNIGDFENIETTPFIHGFTSIKLNSGFELDIMTFLKGFAQEKFDECYKIAPTAMIEEIPVKFLHITQLIEAKKILRKTEGFN
ncbi:MAG: hypothetical protein H0U95_01840 [Bacteroidetes bacterium]|nr:hypothetical protein [Bacteroidota bacterium]